MAAIIAVVANTKGRREIVACACRVQRGKIVLGFLKSLLRRGLKGVKLFVSDVREGLNTVIIKVMGARGNAAGCSWMRNALAFVPKTCMP